MTGCIKNQYYSLNIDQYGKKDFSMIKNGKVLFSLSPLYEFALQIESEEYSGIITSHFCEKEFDESENSYSIRYHHNLFDMEIYYSMDEDAVYKKLHLVVKKDLTVRYAQTEVSKTTMTLTRGGEGQPIFVADAAFVSIIFPAAQNYVDEDTIRLEQAPYISLAAGETFDFYPVVYGFAVEETLEKSFLQYIKRHKKKTPSGLRIYSDWGAHDELANEAKLDEAMAVRLLENLRKAKECGAVFDYYLMDAQWFEETGLYQVFKKKAWPQGPGRFLSELKDMGMQFGLWFDVNLGMLKFPEKAMRYSGDDNRICFGYQENADLLFDGIQAQISQCGCTMLKLDFAFFDCQDAEHSVHAKERIRAKEPAIRNFLNGLAGLYEKNPKLIVLGYNGFTTDLKYIGSVDPNHSGYMISPWWCLYLDYLYCGDPRPSEIPAEKMGDSLIYYTDSMIDGFVDALMPYAAIDDHGTMVGNTNTIYYLGKGSMRDSWVMNISRGAKKTLLYGELELLQREDWQFISQSQEMFDFTCQEEVHTEAVLGKAARGEIYGYSNSNGKRGYLTLVNPGKTESVAVLERDEWKKNEESKIRKIYSQEMFLDSDYEPIKGAFVVKLMPREVAIYQWEVSDSPMTVKEGYAVLEAESSEVIIFSRECNSFSLQLRDEYASPLRLFGSMAEPVKPESLEKGVDIERMHQKPVWSGCSWAVYSIKRDEDGKDNIAVRLHNCSGRRLFVKWCEDR